MLTIGSDNLKAQSMRCHRPSWPASLFLSPPLHSLTIGLPSELKAICEDGLKALAIELRTRALSDKTHSGPSLWQCESVVTAYWTQVLLPQLHFIFRCNVHS